MGLRCHHTALILYPGANLYDLLQTSESKEVESNKAMGVHSDANGSMLVPPRALVRAQALANQRHIDPGKEIIGA